MDMVSELKLTIVSYHLKILKTTPQFLIVKLILCIKGLPLEVY